MLYDTFMYPLESGLLKDIRKDLLKNVKGNVLEIGFGTGVNVKYYSKEIESYIALDISIDEKIRNKFSDIKFIEGDATNLPFNDESFDCVVSTLTLCSVNDTEKVINEIYRVLKKDGTYFFVEHVLPSNKKLASTFKKINPYWLKISKICRLTKETDLILKNSKFDIVNSNKKAKDILFYGTALKNKNH